MTDVESEIDVRVFEVLREEIGRARVEYEEEATVYDPPECPYCDEMMEVGEMGGGHIKYGCYSDDCGIKDEAKYAYYSKRVSTAPASRASGRLESLVDLAHRLALEDGVDR